MKIGIKRAAFSSNTRKLFGEKNNQYETNISNRFYFIKI